MSKKVLDSLMERIAENNIKRAEIISDKDARIKALKAEIARIEQEADRAAFDTKIGKKDIVDEMSQGFIATIPEWAEFLIPIMEDNTGAEWNLVAYWDGHKRDVGILEKFLTGNQPKDIVTSYRIALESDDPNLVPIDFESASSIRGLDIIDPQSDRVGKFLPEGIVNFDKVEPYSFLDVETYDQIDGAIVLKCDHLSDYYPFLAPAIIDRAESIVASKGSMVDKESEMSE